MSVRTKIEVTPERVEIWTECRRRNNCRHCRFKCHCEEYFPTPGNDWSQQDPLPCDYEMSADGKFFYTSVV